MYPTRFPRNHWYAAAHGQDVGRKLLGRQILGDPICFFRRADGRPVALADRCVHRSMPLSLGRLKDDVVECRYHGIQYRDDGRCLRIPSQNHVPESCAVRSYPVVESGGIVWIWMGDPQLADTALLPPHPWLDSPRWTVVRGTLHMAARAQLLNENLLDLSHVAYLHDESIGTEEVAEAPVVTKVDGLCVRVTRDMPDVACPPLFAKAMGLSGRIDRESVAEFVAPGFHVSHVLAKPAGADRSHPLVSQHKAIHCITPETERSAHYLWAVARDYRIDDEGVSQLWAGAPTVLMQDVEAVEAIERVITAYEPGHPAEINIKADAGAVRARRIIEQLVAAEQAQQQSVEAPSRAHSQPESRRG